MSEDASPELAADTQVVIAEKEAREARRRARESWPIRRFDLGHEPSDDLSSFTTAGERLAMVWPLTVLSWKLAGRNMPSYERDQMPGRVLRSGI